MTYTDPGYTSSPNAWPNGTWTPGPVTPDPAQQELARLRAARKQLTRRLNLLYAVAGLAGILFIAVTATGHFSTSSLVAVSGAMVCLANAAKCRRVLARIRQAEARLTQQPPVTQDPIWNRPGAGGSSR